MTDIFELIITKKIVKCSYQGPVKTVVCSIGDIFVPKVILALTTDRNVTSPVWTSSDDSVFTVDGTTGRIVVCGLGEALCTVTVGDMAITFKVKVS